MGWGKPYIPLTLTLRHLCLCLQYKLTRIDQLHTIWAYVWTQGCATRRDWHGKKNGLNSFLLSSQARHRKLSPINTTTIGGGYNKNILKAQKRPKTMTKEKLIHQHNYAVGIPKKDFYEKNELAAKWMPSTWVHSLLQRGLERDSIPFN